MSNSCSDNAKSLFVGLALGFVAGALTALFLTTKTGEELREEVKTAIGDIRKKVEEKAGKVKDITKEKYSEIINSVVSSYHKVRDLTEKEIELIKKVIAESR